MGENTTDVYSEIRSVCSELSTDEFDQQAFREGFSRNNKNYLNLIKFIDKSKFVVNPGNKDINIFVPKGKTYIIPNENLYEFFKLLELCRRDSIVMHFAEKQLDYSGIMLDFDIDHTS